MRYLVALIAALALVGCGEDEQAEPTYDELIAKWLLSFGDNAPDGQLIGAVREAGDMEPLTCQLAGVDTTCYSIDGACGAGIYPSICFDAQAQLVGCIRGSEQPNDSPTAVMSQTTPEGRLRAVVSSALDDPWIICEDQTLPRS